MKRFFFIITIPCFPWLAWHKPLPKVNAHLFAAENRICNQRNGGNSDGNSVGKFYQYSERFLATSDVITAEKILPAEKNFDGHPHSIRCWKNFHHYSIQKITRKPANGKRRRNFMRHKMLPDKQVKEIRVERIEQKKILKVQNCFRWAKNTCWPAL